MIKMIEQTRKYDGFFKLDVMKFDQTRFNGEVMKGVQREVLLRKPVVFLSLFDPISKIHLMVEQVRVGAIAANMVVVEDTTVETVLEPIAGIIDEGETPVQAAVREAAEEAYVDVDPSPLKMIHQGFTSSGTSSEYAYYLVGEFDAPTYVPFNTGGEASEQEDIQTHLIDHDDAVRMLEFGVINSMSGALGVMYHQANLK